MPSAPGYVRDLKRERATQIQRGEHIDNRKRKQARRKLEAKGMVKKGDGLDVDHKKGIAAGNGMSNLQAIPKSENRSYARTSKGAVKKP